MTLKSQIVEQQQQQQQQQKQQQQQQHIVDAIHAYVVSSSSHL